MPGLNFSNISWGGNLAAVTEFLRKSYDTKSPETPFPSSAYYTPYQFTLPILQALYHYFVVELGQETVFERFQDADLSKMKCGDLKATNPETREQALNTSLRAIAYYSWEPGSRLFLIRRVFPTYFDFLSVSHVPEGWGASSLMLEKLQKSLEERIEIVEGSFYINLDMNDRKSLPYHLPYLAEQDRLKYTRMVILPVFSGPKVQSDRDMLGTFVFFLGTGNNVPTRDRPQEVALKLFFNRLCTEMSAIVSGHNARLAPANLAEFWKEVRTTRAGANIVKVVLKCYEHQNGEKECEHLDKAAREFLRALEGPEHHVLRDLDNPKDEAVFLVVGRPGNKTTRRNKARLKENLLRLLIERLGHHSVICDVTTYDHNGRKKTAFLLESDHSLSKSDHPLSK